MCADFECDWGHSKKYIIHELAQWWPCCANCLHLILFLFYSPLPFRRTCATRTSINHVFYISSSQFIVGPFTRLEKRSSARFYHPNEVNFSAKHRSESLSLFFFNYHPLLLCVCSCFILFFMIFTPNEFVAVKKIIFLLLSDGEMAEKINEKCVWVFHTQPLSRTEYPWRWLPFFATYFNCSIKKWAKKKHKNVKTHFNFRSISVRARVPPPTLYPKIHQIQFYKIKFSNFPKVERKAEFFSIQLSWSRSIHSNGLALASFCLLLLSMPSAQSNNIPKLNEPFYRQ